MKRLAITTCIAAIAVAAPVAVLERRPDDLALHKPVQASSVLLGHPANVVNGQIEWGTYAFHARLNQAATFTIDLETPSRIGEVRVFGRGDGYLIDGRGMAVELSSDGKTFRQVAICPGLSTQVAPCRANAGGVTARFVRIAHPACLVLSEVEVFAP
jgi:hypothetical protein